MKKIIPFCLILCTIFLSNAQDFDAYQKIQEEIQQVENKVTSYVNTNIDNVEVEDSFLQGLELEKEMMSQEQIEKSIENHKKKKLRAKFFKEYPAYRAVYKKLESQELLPRQGGGCINPGFDLFGGSLFSYTFFHHEFPPVFDACEMEINTNIPITPGTVNDITAEASLVTNGLDPTLNALGIDLCRTNNCNMFAGNAVRVGSNLGGSDITTMRKTVPITEENFVFSFAAVLENPGHNEEDQPFFQVRIFDENDDLFEVRCIISSPDDCIFTDADPGATLLYTDWSRIWLDTSGLIGQEVTIEFSVADCDLGNHFGYVYIDDLCQEATGSSVFGFVNLLPFDEPGECPDEFPMEVCAELAPPLEGTPNEGTLDDAVLNIIDNNENIVGTITTFSVSGNQICFDVVENDFPDLFIGDFEFEIIVDFEVDCNIDPYIISLEDISTNIGPDVSCALWPRTYGGDDSVLKFTYDITTDDDDNVYLLAALWNGATSHEDTSFLCSDNYALIKHDKYGNLDWIEYIPNYAMAGQIQSHLSFVNDKLIILTDKSYLIGYDLDGNQDFAPYQLTANGDYYNNALDVDKASGDIFVAVRFTQSFSNNHTVTVPPGQIRTGILKFNANGTYNSLSLIGGNASIRDIIYSESLDKLFVSGGGTSPFVFPGSTTITSASFGAEYNNTPFGLAFSSATPFSYPIGQLEFDNNNNRIYADMGSSQGIYIFPSTFSGFSIVATTAFTSNITGFSFNQNTEELYVSSLSSYGKVNISGLIWDIDISTTFPEFITPNTIKHGINNHVYTCGIYKGEPTLGDFTLQEYDSGTESLYVARLRDYGSSAEFKTGMENDNTIHQKEPSFAIHPNPVEKALTLQALQDNQNNISVTVYNLSGIQIKTYPTIHFNTSNTFSIDVIRLEIGIYIIKTKDNKGSTEYYRFIKK